MEDPGEQLVGQYLKYINGCDFVGYNLETKSPQGEIDVVGINSSQKKVYICEVATHLTGVGLLYVKDNRPDNVGRLTAKFRKDIEYGCTNFKDFERIYMLWTTLAKGTSEKAKLNPCRDLREVKEKIKSEFAIDVVIIANEQYMKAVSQLRGIAAKTSYAMKSPIMRCMQIEETLRKNSHLIFKFVISHFNFGIDISQLPRFNLFHLLPTLCQTN